MTNSWDTGLFMLDSSELSTCLMEYTIAHYRGWDGYFPSWYDYEGATEGETKSFEVTVPEVKGDLYFMVDTYYSGSIP